jgi:phage terminase small subunit
MVKMPALASRGGSVGQMKAAMKDEGHLSSKLQRYAENRARGMDSFSAAKSAGYRDSYARVIATRTKKNHLVAEAVAHMRNEGMKLAAYGLLQAMQEADSAAAFTREHKGPMALVKAVELRAKLSGLLVDKVEVVSVDLTKALADAEKRVFAAVDVTPAGAAHWPPRIA